MSKQMNDNDDPVVEGGVPITEDDIEYCATCRPCCTLPHGWKSALTSSVATIAWIFSLMTLAGCQFMKADFTYCEEAQPLFPSCGGCHCANLDQPCPTGADVPFVDYSKESVDQWKALVHLNPMNVTCNPYTNLTCETVPPQVYIEEWEDAVCGVKYSEENLDSDQCPTAYETIAYRSLNASIEDGALITHYGTCGVCSSLKDLAVYVENPDLTGAGQACGIVGLLDFNAGIKCFEDIGYTYPCARMWMYNVLNTRDKCFDTCVDFTFEGDPNNGPAPECAIAPCLQCDEDESGPFFKKVAARTRRRSGLLSKIARPCKSILIVNHMDPCPAKSGDTKLLEDSKPLCHDILVDVGPVRYATVESDLFLDLGFLNSRDDRVTKSFYTECTAYNFQNSVGGFWEVVQDILGAPWAASAAFTIIAFVWGSVALILCWCTTCAAFKQNFWTVMAASFAFCGLFQLLVLVFYKSDVCPDGGCGWLNGSSYTIVSGVLWFIAAVLAQMTRRRAKPGQTIACCCCPTSPDDGNLADMAPLLSGKSRGPPATKITIREIVQADGTKITTKTTKLPDGTRTVETITTQYAGREATFEGSGKTESSGEPKDKSGEEPKDKPGEEPPAEAAKATLMTGSMPAATGKTGKADDPQDS